VKLPVVPRGYVIVPICGGSQRALPFGAQDGSHILQTRRGCHAALASSLQRQRKCGALPGAILAEGLRKRGLLRSAERVNGAALDFGHLFGALFLSRVREVLSC